jgi:hypothetical protein
LLGADVWGGLVADSLDDDDKEGGEEEERGFCDVAGDMSSPAAVSSCVKTGGTEAVIRSQLSRIIGDVPRVAVWAASPFSKFSPLHEEVSEHDGCEEGGVGYEYEIMLSGKSWLDVISSLPKRLGRLQSDLLRGQRDELWEGLGRCFSEDEKLLCAGRCGR